MSMQNEEFYLKKLRQHPDLEMRPEFAAQLKKTLRSQARRHKKSRQIICAVSWGGSLVAVLVLAFWFATPIDDFWKHGFHASSTNTVRGVTTSDGSFVTGASPRVYVYSTHNRESFLPDLHETDPNHAYNPTVNISQVGKRLLTTLATKQVTGIETNVDYWTMGGMDAAYDFSRKTVQNTLKQYASIDVVIDLHRNSQPRKDTTVHIDNQDVGKINLIIGGQNPHKQANEAYAKQLQNTLQLLYPGLSSGVWVKPASPAYNTTYNQDLHSHALLIEIGGPENTLEEEYRSADMLANAIANLSTP